jgi:hypothetical protein
MAMKPAATTIAAFKFSVSAKWSAALDEETVHPAIRQVVRGGPSP